MSVVLETAKVSPAPGNCEGSIIPQKAGLACKPVSKGSGRSRRLIGKLSSQVSSSAKPQKVTELILPLRLRSASKYCLYSQPCSAMSDGGTVGAKLEVLSPAL